MSEHRSKVGWRLLIRSWLLIGYLSLFGTRIAAERVSVSQRVDQVTNQVPETIINTRSEVLTISTDQTFYYSGTKTDTETAWAYKNDGKDKDYPTTTWTVVWHRWNTARRLRLIFELISSQTVEILRTGDIYVLSTKEVLETVTRNKPQVASNTVSVTYTLSVPPSLSPQPPKDQAHSTFTSTRKSLSTHHSSVTPTPRPTPTPQPEANKVLTISTTEIVSVAHSCTPLNWSILWICVFLAYSFV